MKLVHNRLTYLPRVLKLLIFVQLFSYSGGANILFFFGVATYSHRLSVWPLVEQLSERGHNVTFMTAHPGKDPAPNSKIKEFSPKAGNDFIRSVFTEVDHVKNREEGKHTSIWDMCPMFGMGLCDIYLKDSETLKWIKESSFDLVIIDSLYNDCGIGLAYLFNAKYMIFGTSSLYMWNEDAFGITSQSSWIPDMQYHPPSPMSYMQRLTTTLRAVRWHLYREWYLLPHIEKLFRKTFQVPDMPSLRELEKNVSLVFMNTHFTEEFARSLPPLVVSVGGMHCKESKNPLPKPMLDFIEKGNDNGFFYVSFGAAVSIAKMHPDKQKIFINAMRRSNVKFIWRHDDENIKDLPANVFVQSWMPQQDILAHPKIKGFISHGGLLGIQEAIFNAVPMIVFPFFAEQDYNAERIHSRGHGIKLEINTIKQSQLEGAIDAILTDNSYKQNMQKVSNMFKDRPMKPLDLAVWWTEYILRHKDDSALKPLSIHQTWYERRLLDVWGVVMLVVACLISIGAYLIFLVIRKMVSLFVFRPEGSYVRNKKEKSH